jgi:predicted ribosomally synthesized peptide with SipW-like signal peptide
MKKITIALAIIILVAGVALGVTGAVFSDTEKVENNIFAAGELNLKVNGQNGPLTAKFTSDDMKPGNTYNGGCVTLKNVGSMDGTVSVKINNLISHENGITDPESKDGDVSGTQIDPTGYNNNTGNGELWDQITIKACFDDGTGSHTGNGQCDWDDTILKGFSSTQDDYSATHSIKLDTDLAAGKNIVLNPGEKIDFCVGVKFIDDTSNSWWGGQGNLTNNMAMGDDAQFDVAFGLEQTQ